MDQNDQRGNHQTFQKRSILTYKEAEQVMNEIMENTASDDVQKAA